MLKLYEKPPLARFVTGVRNPGDARPLEESSVYTLLLHMHYPKNQNVYSTSAQPGFPPIQLCLDAEQKCGMIGAGCETPGHLE